jgi:hypothetical protein
VLLFDLIQRQVSHPGAGRSLFLLESEAVGCAATPADVAVATTAPSAKAMTAAPATISLRFDEADLLGLR